MSADTLTARLLAVRDGAPVLGDVPAALRPVDLTAAYATADEIVVALERRWGDVVGYKVGATSTAGQGMLGLTEPFYGRIFAGCVVAGEGPWTVSDGRSSAEAEVGFVLGADLPPGQGAYSLEAVAAAVARVIPLIEINRPAYERPFEVGGLCLIADNGVTQGLVRGGPGVALVDPEALAHETVSMVRDGASCADGRASVVLGNPLNALVWLANTLNARGTGLRVGDVVASGAMTPPIPIAAGDRLSAEYSTLGRIEFRVAGGTT